MSAGYTELTQEYGGIIREGRGRLGSVRRLYPGKIVEMALNGRVADGLETQDGKPDVEAMQGVRDKIEGLQRKWEEFIWTNSQISEEVLNLFNELHSSEAVRNFQHPYQD
ncbi:hypothetical protein RZS08_36805, partial [Arthrospira platensis SPKY1]|nr:hypothetical protein [Arthrospira platensis SPKY1]